MILPRLTFHHTDGDGNVFKYDLLQTEKRRLTTLSALRESVQKELDELSPDDEYREVCIQQIEQIDEMLKDGDFHFIITHDEAEPVA